MEDYVSYNEKKKKTSPQICVQEIYIRESFGGKTLSGFSFNSPNLLAAGESVVSEANDYHVFWFCPLANLLLENLPARI